jgi:hypothetical protein
MDGICSTHIPIYLSIYLSLCQPVYLSLYQFIYYFCFQLGHWASVKRLFHFSFLILDSLIGTSARRKAATYTQTQNKRKYPCLKWGLAPLSQCSTRQGHFMP